MFSSLVDTQASLPISLIATPREQFRTATLDQAIGEVRAAHPDFDHVPVQDHATDEIVGILDLARSSLSDDSLVEAVYEGLNERQLIGADAPIIDFVCEAGEQPYRLVVSSHRISGIVTISDLQALPVRAALFAEITNLEMAMKERIRTIAPKEEEWLSAMNNDRREKRQRELQKARDGNVAIDGLSMTQFCDKRDILLKLDPQIPSKRQFEKDLKRAETLRNNLAHANTYANDNAIAKKVCDTVRKIGEWRDYFSEL